MSRGGVAYVGSGVVEYDAASGCPHVESGPDLTDGIERVADAPAEVGFALDGELPRRVRSVVATELAVEIVVAETKRGLSSFLHLPEPVGQERVEVESERVVTEVLRLAEVERKDAVHDVPPEPVGEAERAALLARRHAAIGDAMPEVVAVGDEQVLARHIEATGMAGAPLVGDRAGAEPVELIHHVRKPSVGSAGRGDVEAPAERRERHTEIERLVVALAGLR